MGFSLLDGFIVVILAAGLIRGFTVGAVRQIASLLGVFLALLVSAQLMHPIGGLLVATIGLSEAAGPIVGFVALFVGVWLLFVVLSRLLEHLIETLSLTLVNRAAGGLVGGLKAALLLSVLFLVLSQVEMPDRETRHQSVLYGPVASALPKTLEVASDYLPAAKRMSDTFGETVRPHVQSSGRTVDSASDVAPSPR